MGCRVEFCMGGACVPTNSSVELWLAAFGGEYNPSDPYDYSQVVSEDNPYPTSYQPQSAAWAACCEASLRARALLFCNSSPNEVNVGAEVASEVGAVGGSFAPIPGVGALISGITGLFTAGHAKAVTNQANYLTEMQTAVTNLITETDAQVNSGQITPQDAAVVFSQLAAQFKSNAPEFKSGNGYDWYYCIIKAFADSAPGWYSVHTVGISPSTAPEIANAEDLVATGAVGNPAQQAATPISAILTPAPASSSSTILIILAIIGVVWFSGRLNRG